MSKQLAVFQVIMAGIAIIISVAALVVAFTRTSSDPLGKGMQAYDFSTPEAAVKSIAAIKANMDIRAQRDLDNKRIGDPVDALKTLEIHKTVDFQDKKIVFARYQQKGYTKRSLFVLEKDFQSKAWIESKYLSSWEVKKTDEQLGKEMESWQKNGD